MSDTLTSSLRTLRATPEVIRALLYPLDSEDYGELTGEPKESISDVLHRLAKIEKQHFLPSIRQIKGEEVPEVTVYRPPSEQAGATPSSPKGMTALVKFEKARVESVEYLETLAPEDLSKEGSHPEAGRVRIEELLNAWAFSDLSHIQELAELVKKIGFSKGIGRMKEIGDGR